MRYKIIIKFETEKEINLENSTLGRVLDDLPSQKVEDVQIIKLKGIDKNPKVHMIGKIITGSEKFLLKKDGTWNILCDKQGMSTCRSTENPKNVTCKKCLKLLEAKE